MHNALVQDDPSKQGLRRHNHQLLVLPTNTLNVYNKTKQYRKKKKKKKKTETGVVVKTNPQQMRPFSLEHRHSKCCCLQAYQLSWQVPVIIQGVIYACFCRITGFSVLLEATKYYNYIRSRDKVDRQTIL